MQLTLPTYIWVCGYPQGRRQPMGSVSSRRVSFPPTALITANNSSTKGRTLGTFPTFMLKSGPAYVVQVTTATMSWCVPQPSQVWQSAPRSSLPPPSYIPSAHLPSEWPSLGSQCEVDRGGSFPAWHLVTCTPQFDMSLGIDPNLLQREASLTTYSCVCKQTKPVLLTVSQKQPSHCLNTWQKC